MAVHVGELGAVGRISYDALNRLVEYQGSGTHQIIQGGTGNHVPGFNYDAAGNVTNDTFYNYTYNVYGRPAMAGSATANAGNVTHRFLQIREITAAGSSVLMLDYRGYGKSEGSPGEPGLYADADAAYLYLLGHGYSARAHRLTGRIAGHAGFSISLVARQSNSIIAAGLLSVLCSLVFLIALGKEGVLCAVLAFPIILAGLAIGAMIGVQLRKFLARRAANPTTTTGLLLLVAPLVIVAGARVERPLLQYPRIETIQTTIEANDSLEHVWRDILTIDSVQATKPLLMYVGLPIPQRCTMQGRGLGAKRTCYFNVGYIEETVTAWNPPYKLGLSIDRTHMPGRHWLGFERAEYRLESKRQTTVLTRITTVTSNLAPSWYWRPFERLGVESEHRYILQNVANRTRR